MLQDPIYVGLPTTTNIDNLRVYVSGSLMDLVNGLTLRTVDISPGGSVRVYNDGTTNYRLTIAHSSTKENAPYGTVRTTIRLDATRVDADGKPVTVFAQKTIGTPAGGPHAADMPLRLSAALDLFTLTCDLTSGFASQDAGNTVTARILAGEP